MKMKTFKKLYVKNDWKCVYFCASKLNEFIILSFLHFQNSTYKFLNIKGRMKPQNFACSILRCHVN